MPVARQAEITYPSWAEIADTWLIFNGQVYCVRSMPEEDIRSMVAALTTKPIRTELALDTITDYDGDFERWYVMGELQQKRNQDGERLLVLYDTQVEAEQALLLLPMPEPTKRRKSKSAS